MIGDIVVQCYYWFDQSFQNLSHNRMTTMLATPKTMVDPHWFPNSRATSHYTLDLNNLTIEFEYGGSKKMYMGNGKGLNISRIRETSFLSSQHVLHLKNLWTRIFHLRPHSINETHFYWWKISFGKVGVAIYFILFYFKKKNKTRKKTLKKWLHSFWKNVSLKNPSLGSGIKLPIRKLPLKGNTHLSPTKVFID